MMKKYILLATVALSLAACNNDNFAPDQPIAARISASIGNSVVSRASDNEWSDGDQIGITMTGDGVSYVNMEYTTGGNGEFTGTPMYLRNSKDPVTLTAYYPFTGTEGAVPGTDGVIEASTPADRQTSEEQAKFDFLFAPEVSVSGSKPEVNFNFSHKMSKLTLIFKSGLGTDVTKITSYTIEGLVLDGTFKPADGTCEASDVDASQLTINPTAVTSGEKLPSLILFPQSVQKKVTLKITDSDGQDYLGFLEFKNEGTVDNKLMSGKNYLFTITVNKASLTVNSSIAEWIDEESEGDASSDLSQIIPD